MNNIVYLRADRALVGRRWAERPDHFFGPNLCDSQFADLEEPGDALTLDAALPLAESVDRICREWDLL